MRRGARRLSERRLCCWIGLLRMPRGCCAPHSPQALLAAGTKWHSANPPALIGAKGGSRWPVLCSAVGSL